MTNFEELNARLLLVLEINLKYNFSFNIEQNL